MENYLRKPEFGKTYLISKEIYNYPNFGVSKFFLVYEKITLAQTHIFTRNLTLLNVINLIILSLKINCLYSSAVSLQNFDSRMRNWKLDSQNQISTDLQSKNHQAPVKIKLKIAMLL